VLVDCNHSTLCTAVQLAVRFPDKTRVVQPADHWIADCNILLYCVSRYVRVVHSKADRRMYPFIVLSVTW
jgi:hypothetical protein